MNNLTAAAKHGRLYSALSICWLLTVATSFLRNAIITIRVPMVGDIFPFRVFLPLTLCLYIAWAAANRINVLRARSSIGKWSFLFIAILLAYGLVSLPRAIDFGSTFRLYFNLCFDLAFFYLALQLCRDKRLMDYTLLVTGAMVVFLCATGIWEVFFGGIWNSFYDDLKYFHFLGENYQYPLVTYHNTNDLISSLIFCMAILSLKLFTTQAMQKNSYYLLWTLMMAAQFFLATAAVSRLGIIALLMLLGVSAVFFLLCDRKRLWAPLLILLAFLWMSYGSQLSLASKVDVQMSLGLAPGAETLDIVDEGADTARLMLLLHALRCFLYSRGLGVGMGNTSALAVEWKAIPVDPEFSSIHCFVARLVADCGIFALIPLCVIGFLLLRCVWLMISKACRSGSLRLAAEGLVYLVILGMYVVLSTMSSDAQDLIAMWLYLALVVVFAERFNGETAPLAE